MGLEERRCPFTHTTLSAARKSFVKHGVPGLITPDVAISAVHNQPDSGVVFRFPGLESRFSIVVISNSAQEKQVLNEYDFGGLRIAPAQRRILEYTRGGFILSADDKETWREQRVAVARYFTHRHVNTGDNRRHVERSAEKSVRTYFDLLRILGPDLALRGLATDLTARSLLGVGFQTDVLARMINSYHSYTPMIPLVAAGIDRFGPVGRYISRLLSGYNMGIEDLVARAISSPAQTEFVEEFIAKIDFNSAVDAYRGIAAGLNVLYASLRFMLYELATNPETQTTTRAAANERDLETIQRFIEGTLFKYPVTLYVGRQATKEIEIGGQVIPKNSLVLMGHFALKNSCEINAAPDPARKHYEAQFGSGPRRCLGYAITTVMLQETIMQVLNQTKEIRVNNSPIAVMGPIVLSASKKFDFEFI